MKRLKMQIISVLSDHVLSDEKNYKNVWTLHVLNQYSPVSQSITPIHSVNGISQARNRATREMGVEIVEGDQILHFIFSYETEAAQSYQ